MDKQEKRKGKCDLCEKPNRVLAKIESGQWICHTCRISFASTKEKKKAQREEAKKQPTERQLEFARELGLNPDGYSRRGLSPLISVAIYVRDVLAEIRISPPPPDEYMPFIYQLASSSSLVYEIEQIKEWRYDWACNQVEKIQDESDDPYISISIYDHYPPVPRDRTYDYVWACLEKALGDRLPKRSQSPSKRGF